MSKDKKISGNEIVRFSLDIWEETGLLTHQPHSAGRFYFSERFSEREFNFFMPDFNQKALSASTLADISKFYASRHNEPLIYCPDKMVERLGDAVGEGKIREVIMRANVDEVLERLADKTPSEKLVLGKMNDFSNPAYLGVYNSVFLSADSTSQYDKIYETFIDLFGNAAKGGASFSPWVMLGTLDGEAASAATIVPKGPLAGLYNLATKPECRGQGLAAQVMREAFRQARDAGATTLFLITEWSDPKKTETGLALEKAETELELEKMYTRMGFKTFARYSGVMLNPV